MKLFINIRAIRNNETKVRQHNIVVELKQLPTLDLESILELITPYLNDNYSQVEIKGLSIKEQVDATFGELVFTSYREHFSYYAPKEPKVLKPVKTKPVEPVIAPEPKRVYDEAYKKNWNFYNPNNVID